MENRGNYRLNGTLPIVNLIDLPLEDKDRVEALKGASALYYGFTAPAGIINLTMKRPTLDPYIAATIFGNEYGQLGGHVDAGNTWGPLGARVNAVYGSVDSGIDNTRGHRSLLAAAFDFKPSDNLTRDPRCRAHRERGERAWCVSAIVRLPTRDGRRICIRRCSCRRYLDPERQFRSETGRRIMPKSATCSPRSTGRSRRPGRCR